MFVADEGEPCLARQTIVLVALSPLALSFATNVWNDVPYGLAVLLGLGAFRHAVKRRSRCLAAGVLAIGLVAAAYFIYVAALALLAAAVAYCALHRRWRLGAATALVFALAAVPWEARCYHLTHSRPTVYEDHLTKLVGEEPSRRPAGPALGMMGKLARRGQLFARAQSVGIAGALVPPPFVGDMGDDCFPYFRFHELWDIPDAAGLSRAKWALVWVCVLLVVGGWASKLRGRVDIRDLYFAAYLALLVLGAPRDRRQVMSILPFLFYYALVAAGRAGSWLVGARTGARRAVFVLLLAANMLASLCLVIQHQWGLATVDPSTDRGLAQLYPPDWAVRIAAARRVADGTAEGTPVICRRGYGEVLHFLAGFKVVPLPKGVSDTAFMRFMQNAADFAILMPGRRQTDWVLWRVLSGRCPGLDEALCFECEGERVHVLCRSGMELASGD